MKNLSVNAIKIAKKAHGIQIDKCGMPYWLHPYRVGVSVREYGDDYVAAAFLHDVVEDTDLTFDDLRREGMPEHVIRTVDALTRRKGESYNKFIKRSLKDSMAKIIKAADIRDNLRHDRAVLKKGHRRMYEKSLKVLEEKEKE